MCQTSNVSYVRMQKDYCETAEIIVPYSYSNSEKPRTRLSLESLIVAHNMDEY